MTEQQKIGGAILALQMIANTGLQRKWIATSESGGYYRECKQCKKMKQIAQDALKCLEPDNQKGEADDE